MKTIREITGTPEFDSQATDASKLSITIFFLVTLYLVFFLDNTTNIFTAIAFFLIGMFIVSIFIAAPFFVVRKKFPKIIALVVLTEMGAIVFITLMAFSYFFTNPMDFPVASSPNGIDSHEIQCSEPIPVFPLSGSTKPTAEQLTGFCECIWSSMSHRDKNTSTAISEGREADVSELILRGFITSFGSKIGVCVQDG